MIQTDSIEELGLGVTREWVNDHRIVVFTIADVSRAAVDAWMDAVTQTMNTWTADTIYIVHDYTPSKTSMLTPYMRARIQELYEFGRDLRGHLAVVLPRTFITILMKAFLNKQERTGITVYVCFSREEALRELEKIMAPTTSGA